MIAEGPLDIQWVLEDIFALSQLVFTAPDKCIRLPLTIKLADDFLEPIAAEVDEEAARYETEGMEEFDGTVGGGPVVDVTEVTDNLLSSKQMNGGTRP